MGKQSGANSGGARGTGSKNNTEKVDKDGSFRVPGYRGVWINPAGKNFIKIKNEIFLENCDKKLFDTSDEAAKFYDQVVKERDLTDAELNYKDDGETRIVYDDKSSMASAGRGLEMLGGGTSSVVPALSVINIKVRIFLSSYERSGKLCELKTVFSPSFPCTLGSTETCETFTT